MRQREFREHVLALMMVSDQFCAAASAMVAPRYFENPVEQHLCRFILEYFREFHKAPNKMVLRTKGYAYLNTAQHLKPLLAEFDTLLDTVEDLDKSATKQMDYIQNEVRDFCKREAFKDALLKSVEDIQASKFDVVMDRIQKAQSIGAELNGRGIYMLEDAEGRQTVEDVRFPIASGYNWLDVPTKGGIGRGELFILMAPPNTGKTTGMINIGVGTCKHRHKVAHFSLEMDKGIVRAKYDQCFMKKSDEELKAVDKDGFDAITQWMRKLRKNLGSDIYIQNFPAHRLSISGLRSELMLLKSRDGFVPDMVILDYLDLLMMPTHIEDPVKQLTWLGEEYRALAQELGFAGVTASQTNRGGALAETAMETHIGDDFKKAATADFMASLNQTMEESEEEKARIFWIKNRLGIRRKTYNMQTDYARSLLIQA